MINAGKAVSVENCPVGGSFFMCRSRRNSVSRLYKVFLALFFMAVLTSPMTAFAKETVVNEHIDSAMGTIVSNVCNFSLQDIELPSIRINGEMVDLALPDISIAKQASLPELFHLRKTFHRILWQLTLTRILMLPHFLPTHRKQVQAGVFGVPTGRQNGNGKLSGNGSLTGNGRMKTALLTVPLIVLRTMANGWITVNG